MNNFSNWLYFNSPTLSKFYEFLEALKEFLHTSTTPGSEKSNKFKKTGLAAIFTASLELTKDGVLNLVQENLFDDVLIRAATHTPLKLKEK